MRPHGSLSLALALLTAVSAAAVRAADSQSDLDGLWLSDGYGLLAEIRGGRIDLFELTPMSCIASHSLTESAAREPDPRGRYFADADGSMELFLAPGPSPDSEWFGDPSAASRIRFRHTDSQPEPCGKPVAKDPPAVFEIFAWTFGAHHGFLRHRGVDWAATVANARPRVTRSTTRAELFRILGGMIEPLHDEHTFIRAPDLKREFGNQKPGTFVMTDAERKRSRRIVETRYLSGAPRTFCGGHLRLGRLRAGPAYLRIDAFYGYSKTPGFDAGARALEAALDEVVKAARMAGGLVVDIRINQGGSDPYGVRIASRLTDTPYTAYVKRARNDAENSDSWTDPQTVAVAPSTRYRFAGAVVELIGPETVSAGETFTMALMGREPRVTRIGEDTQGVYSDVLVRSLPNGWTFGLPNEVFLTESGEHFEARGVPPDVRVSVFAKSDLAAGRDPALERAIAELAKPSEPVVSPR